jgi:DNA-binding YbaB/EbfC family protein
VTAEGPDLGGLLGQMQQLQQQLMDAQEEAASRVVEGSAGGGMVRVRVTGGLDFQEITIDSSVVDPGDVEMLQDLILAAVRDAVARVNETNQEAMKPLGLGGGLEGLLGGE